MTGNSIAHKHNIIALRKNIEKKKSNTDQRGKARTRAFSEATSDLHCNSRSQPASEKPQRSATARSAQ